MDIGFEFGRFQPRDSPFLGCASFGGKLWTIALQGALHSPLTDFDDIEHWLDHFDDRIADHHRSLPKASFRSENHRTNAIMRFNVKIRHSTLYSLKHLENRCRMSQARDCESLKDGLNLVTSAVSFHRRAASALPMFCHCSATFFLVKRRLKHDEPKNDWPSAVLKPSTSKGPVEQFVPVVSSGLW